MTMVTHLVVGGLLFVEVLGKFRTTSADLMTSIPLPSIVVLERRIHCGWPIQGDYII